MSFTVGLFLQLLLSAFWSNAQTTSSDRDKGEDYVSNLEYIWQSLEKIRQDLEHHNCSPDGSKTVSHRGDCEDRNSTCSDILLSLEKTNRLLESLANENRSTTGHRCPSGFNHRAKSVDKCYAVVLQTMDWDAAQARCRALNPKAHLVVINSPLENQIISEILNEYDCNGSEEYNWFWIGGRRQNLDDCSSSFVWKTNSRNNQAIVYSNFCPGEPDCSSQSQNCMTIAKDCHSAEGISGWQDDFCLYTFCPICEVVRLEQP